jgi:hypothetical protein
VFYENYLSIKTKLNNNGVNMPKPTQFKKLLILMLLFNSSMNVFSQTIKTYVDNDWEDSRYINHHDGTVTYTKTGLMWKQCPEGLRGSDCLTSSVTVRVCDGCKKAGRPLYNYKAAIEYAEKNATFATYSDWRLPNIKELSSLAAFDRHDPAINSTIFPNVSHYFVSSSPSTESNTVWTLGSPYGHKEIASGNLRFFVRLVRGGQ